MTERLRSRFNTARAAIVARKPAVVLLGLTLLLVGRGLDVLAGQVPAGTPSDSGKGFIWSVSGKGHTGWLVGSLHLLPQEAYPLPPSMDAAFEDAEVLVEEADPSELSTPEAAAELLSRAFLPPGETLDGHVSPATFRLLGERAANVGVPVALLRQMRPWMAAVTLVGLEMQKSGFDPALGLDRHFRDRARAASKPVRTVETALEQIRMLEGLGPSLQEALAVEALREASTEVNQAQALFAAWQAGDVPGMEKVLVDGTKSSPDIYEVLFVQRNRRWMPKIEECLAGARCMVVVGAGHLVGPDGLIALLRARGYAVEQR